MLLATGLLAATTLLGQAPRSAVASAPPATAPATTVAVDVRVDPRVELVCIIFRLAGHPEYNQSRVDSYSTAIQAHFGPFQEHDAVRLARRLRQSRGIGFDAPMSLAVRLTDPPALELAEPLEPWPQGLDGRWRSEDVRQFVSLARDFAEDSRFNQFFEAHQALYAQSAQRLRQTLERSVRLEWFERFFGRGADADFHLVIGLCNGGSNYGARTERNGRAQLYSILGVWSCDEQGAPQFPAGVVPTIVHEFSHSFANPLIDAHYPELAAAGQKLYAHKATMMHAQAYRGGKTVLYESLVRACVLRYRIENEGMAAGLSEAMEQRLRGFDWIGELSTALAHYQSHRDEYPTLAAFMPELARCLNDYAATLPDAED